MNDYEDEQVAKVPASKRGVAFLCDVVLIFVASVLITTVMHLIDLVVPLLTRYLSQVLIACLLLLIRDYFNSGRGFGKMFMGLEVVDYDTWESPSIMQSIKRNIFLFAPVIMAELVQIILFVLPRVLGAAGLHWPLRFLAAFMSLLFCLLNLLFTTKVKRGDVWAISLQIRL